MLGPIVRQFFLALGAVAVFSFFAWLSQHYRKKKFSRILMWAGIGFFLAGCYLFGINVIYLPLVWMMVTIAFFAVLFSLAAGFFLRRGRKMD